MFKLNEIEISQGNVITNIRHKNQIQNLKLQALFLCRAMQSIVLHYKYMTDSLRNLKNNSKVISVWFCIFVIVTTAFPSITNLLSSTIGFRNSFPDDILYSLTLYLCLIKFYVITFHSHSITFYLVRNCCMVSLPSKSPGSGKLTIRTDKRSDPGIIGTSVQGIHPWSDIAEVRAITEQAQGRVISSVPFSAPVSVSPSV